MQAIPTLEGTDAILDGHYKSRKNVIVKWMIFGGWYSASATAPSTFNKYGKSTLCKDDGEGGPFANHVYIVTTHS